jgi:S-adenosylmethionine decarboxylase
LLFNIVNPDTFNVDNMVVLLEVKVFEFNDDKTVVLFDIILYALTLYTPELLTFILYNKFRLKKISKLYYIMVQLYNPNVTGKQILIDTKNIDGTKLKLIENVQPLMEKIIQELNLNVVQKCEHQFEKNNEPYGCTMMYLLSESHLSIHTFVDEGKISLDLFTCGLGTDFDKLRYIIRDYFDVNILCINSYYFTRGD